MRLSKVSIISGLVIIALLLGGCGNSGSTSDVDNQNLTNNKYDKLAQHLTDIGVKIYGASTCPACQRQKELFGDSWKYINYIECSTPAGYIQARACQVADIKSYPTWEFPDGEKITGVLSPEKLAQIVNFVIEE